MIVTLNATICIVNEVSETNITRKRHVHNKKFLLVLVRSTVIDTIVYASSTILVMVPVDAGFSGGVLSPTFLLGQTLHCTLHLGLNCQ